MLLVATGQEYTAFGKSGDPCDAMPVEATGQLSPTLIHTTHKQAQFQFSGEYTSGAWGEVMGELGS